MSRNEHRRPWFNWCVQNFPGADTISVVNSRLMKRTLLAGIILLGMGLAARADFDPIFGFYRPELFTAIDSTDLIRDLSMREFLNAQLPGSTILIFWPSTTSASMTGCCFW